MPEGQVNLLPRDRIDAARKHYFFRLVVVSALALAAIVVIHGVLLIPAYTYVHQDISSKETRVQELSSSQVATAQGGASAELASLTNDAGYLSNLSKQPTMSGAATLVLAVPRPGVTLDSFVLSPVPGGPGLQMTVSGAASTREALHAYVSALQAEPWVKSADLPISAYAADTNVAFTITLVGTFTP